MSKDLLAEFTDFGEASSGAPSYSQPAQNKSAPSFSFFDDLQQPSAITTSTQTSLPTSGSITYQPYGFNTGNASTVDDDWGDFEDAVPDIEPQGAAAHEALRNDLSKAADVRPTADLAHGYEQNLEVLKSSVNKQQLVPEAQSSKRERLPRDPNVLFDQDEVNEDDFGDFEDAETPAEHTLAPRPPAVKVQQSLIDFDLDEPQTTSKEVQNTAPSAPAPDPQQHILQNKVSVQSIGAPLTISEDTDDAWDDFTSSPVTGPSASKPFVSHTASPSAFPISASPTIPNISSDDLPPTNIPPPATLLTLFPAILQDNQHKFFEPLSKLSQRDRSTLLSSPKAADFLLAHLALGTVAGHIIAGRKLRWKRDMHLSQGMRIGPAAAGGGGGMKLTAVAKTNVQDEEREAVDVVRLWKAQVGRLRITLAAAKTASASNPAKQEIGGKSIESTFVPDLQENIPVQVARQVDGGVPAKTACMLCGLKREERVPKVEERVEDSFGEWWVEQVNMHRSCRNFWWGHRDALRSR